MSVMANGFLKTGTLKTYTFHFSINRDCIFVFDTFCWKYYTPSIPDYMSTFKICQGLLHGFIVESCDNWTTLNQQKHTLFFIRSQKSV